MRELDSLWARDWRGLIQSYAWFVMALAGLH